MGYENDELKHVECDLCGYNMKCFLQYDYGVQHAICPECLRTMDHIPDID